MEEAYKSMGQAYEALDKAHNSYSSLVGEAAVESEGDYLGESVHLFSDAQVAYSQVTERRDRAQSLGSFKTAKSKVIAGMQVFKGSCKVLAKLSLEKRISFTDMRTELGKIEAQYGKLSTERAGVKSIFHSAEDTTLVTKFAELVGEGFK